jgi:probable rRNA maturation factor
MTPEPKAKPGLRASKARNRLSVSISCDHAGWRPIAGQRRIILSAINAALQSPPVMPLAGAELSVLLTGDERMREINASWRGIGKPTNVLSFPAVTGPAIAASPMLGDIVLALETVRREALEEGKDLEAHVTHLVIHGLYHLLGDDHGTEHEANLMEQREIAALALLGIANPYQERHDGAQAVAEILTA